MSLGRAYVGEVEKATGAYDHDIMIYFNKYMLSQQ